MVRTQSEALNQNDCLSKGSCYHVLKLVQEEYNQTWHVNYVKLPLESEVPENELQLSLQYSRPVYHSSEQDLIIDTNTDFNTTVKAKSVSNSIFYAGNRWFNIGKVYTENENVTDEMFLRAAGSENHGEFFVKSSRLVMSRLLSIRQAILFSSVIFSILE